MTYYSVELFAEDCDSFAVVVAVEPVAALGHWRRRWTKSLANPDLEGHSTALDSTCLAECLASVAGWSSVTGEVGPSLEDWLGMWTLLGRYSTLNSPFGRSS